MNLQQTQGTVTTLANANELVFNIVRGVLGNDVADTFNGSPISRQVIYNLTQARMQMALAPFLKVNQHA